MDAPRIVGAVLNHWLRFPNRNCRAFGKHRSSSFARLLVFAAFVLLGLILFGCENLTPEQLQAMQAEAALAADAAQQIYADQYRAAHLEQWATDLKNNKITRAEFDDLVSTLPPVKK